MRQQGIACRPPKLRPDRKPPVSTGDEVEYELLTAPDRFIQGFAMGAVFMSGVFTLLHILGVI